MAEKEVWKIKDNGGKAGMVGIVSNRSKWFIAEEVLPKNAELICELFNNRPQINETKLKSDNKQRVKFWGNGSVQPDTWSRDTTGNYPHRSHVPASKLLPFIERCVQYCQSFLL